MTLIREILEEILREITPTNQELSLIKEITDKLKLILDQSSRRLNIHYTKIEAQGSTGIKQTQLKNDFDIDLFIGLDYNLYKPKYEGLSRNQLKKTSKKDFLDLCNRWLMTALTSREFHNPRLLYAEHPYVTVDYRVNNIKIKIDIVLYFDLELDYIQNYGPITAVDRSPWHGRFIKTNLTKGQKNDARLLKQFFKANHSYGDKSPVGKVGFIGYSAELLIYYYNTIENLFSNFDRLINNPADYHGRSPKELKEIPHFQNDYLIITDPIDKNRNVGSAISPRAYRYCRSRIKEFLKNPDASFFIIEAVPEFKITGVSEKFLSNLFIVELENEDEDIHYTINRDKLHSLGESIKANGEKEYSHVDRFGKITHEVYFEENLNNYCIAIHCENPLISKSYMRKGPPLNEKKHVESFRNKNPICFEKEGHLWVETFRQYTQFLDFLKDFIRDKVPNNFNILNVSESLKVKSTVGKKALYVLEKLVLPYL